MILIFKLLNNLSSFADVSGGNEPIGVGSVLCIEQFSQPINQFQGLSGAQGVGIDL